MPGWTEHYCQTVERGALAAGAEVDSSSSDTRIDSLCSISRSEILSILTEADVQVHECELRATGGNAQRQAHKSNGIRELTLTPAIRFTWLTAFTTNLFGFQATHV